MIWHSEDIIRAQDIQYLTSSAFGEESNGDSADLQSRKPTSPIIQNITNIIIVQQKNDKETKDAEKVGSCFRAGASAVSWRRVFGWTCATRLLWGGREKY